MLSNFKIRCSSIGAIMTEPQSKAAKDAGELSETAKTHLVECYVRFRYGRIKMIDSKYLQKGRRVEEESITLFSRYDRSFYRKNDQRLENEYLSGELDLFKGPSIKQAKAVVDIKSSWDLFTFLKAKTQPINKDYWWQLQGYGALSGALDLKLAYCLCNTPSELVDDEKRKLAYSMGVIDQLHAPDYIDACRQIDINSNFDDLTLAERVFVRDIAGSPMMVESIYEKVEKSRQWLAQTFYPSDTLTDTLQKSLELQNQESF